ncbi:AMP-dependent synthetase/ligase [Actinotalea fermentans]|nr:AMP-binding protein [Actinotalea fermentans]
MSSPPLADLTGVRNTTDLLAGRVAGHPDAVAFDVREPGAPVDAPWRPVTTAAFEAHVRAIAKGLVAAGLAPGDAVAVMAPTRYEWALVDMAVWYAGGVVVPVYETSAQVQVSAVVLDADVRLAVGGGPRHVELLTHALAEAGRPAPVWSMDAAPGHDLTALVALGADLLDDVVDARRTGADLDDVATIVYTSGTTSAPRGALITHRNLVGQVLSVAAAYTDVVREGGSTVIFLPLAHVLARGLQLVCLAGGMRIAHLGDPREVVPALAVLKPTFLVVVPRVLQKVHAAATAAAADKHLGRVWASAQRTAIAWGRLAEAADEAPAAAPGTAAPGTAAPAARGSDVVPARPSVGLRLRHAVYERLFYRRLRARLGGRVDYLLSGAAALDADLSLFFRGIGVPVIEGYGLTETTAPLTGNLPGSIRSGSVGVPMPGTTVRIADDGEVLARGVGVFRGYRNPEAHAEAFVDGFFRTGDLGSLDERGRLVLHGRVKDVIVTSGGKTVSPADWERYVEREPMVAHAMVVGEGKPYLGGVLLLDPESVAAWAHRHGIADLGPLQLPSGGAVEVHDSRLVAAIGAVVAAANARLSAPEQVRRFALVLADLSEASGTVTPTMKLKRAAIAERVRDIVDRLYHGAPSPA